MHILPSNVTMYSRNRERNEIEPSAIALVHIQSNSDEGGSSVPPENADQSSICEDAETELTIEDVHGTVISDSTNKNEDDELKVQAETDLEPDEVPVESRMYRYLTNTKNLLISYILDLKLFFWYGSI